MGSNHDSSRDPLTRVLALIRTGAAVRVGGGRWSETFSFRDGGWYAEVFDEGERYEGATSAAKIREAYELSPAPFLALLGEPFWEKFADALVAGDRDRARTWLEQGRACGAPDLDILGAYLAWPGESPSDEVRQRIARAISEQRAVSIYLEAVLQRHGDVVARRGIELLDALGAMTGEPLHFFGQRALLRIRAGDIRGAIADFQREVDRIPGDVDESSADGRARQSYLVWLAELRARTQR